MDRHPKITIEGSTLWAPDPHKGTHLPEPDLTPTYGYQSRIISTAAHSESDTTSRNSPKPVAPMPETAQHPGRELIQEPSVPPRHPLVIYDNDGNQVWPPLEQESEPGGVKGLPGWAATLGVTVAVVLVVLGALVAVIAASFGPERLFESRYAGPRERAIMHESSVACANAVQQTMPLKSVQFIESFDPDAKDVAEGLFETGGTLKFVNTTEEPYIHTYSCTVEVDGDAGHISRIVVQNPANEEPLVDYSPDEEERQSGSGEKTVLV